MLYVNTGVNYDSLEEFLLEFADLFDEAAQADLQMKNADANATFLSIQTGPGAAYAVVQAITS